MSIVELSTLTQKQLDFYHEYGYLQVQNFFSGDFADGIGEEIENYIAQKNIAIRFRNQFFPDSAEPVFRFIYSEQDLDAKGIPIDNGFVKYFNFYDVALTQTNQLLFADSVKNIMRSLGFEKPRIGFIDYLKRTSYKTPQNDKAHIEEDHIFTVPRSTTVFWFNLNDVDAEHGCLWVLPKAHKQEPQSTQLIRYGQEVKYRFRDGRVSDNFYSNLVFDRKNYIPLPSQKGDLVILHGQLPHIGDYNIGSEEKKRVTVAVVDGACEYPAENFVNNDLQKPFAFFY